MLYLFFFIHVNFYPVMMLMFYNVQTTNLTFVDNHKMYIVWLNNAQTKEEYYTTYA